jgi:hypothetical protein
MPIGKAWAYKHAILRSFDAKCYYRTNDDERADVIRMFKELNQ